MSEDGHAPARHRVVIVGGGFAGLSAARALEGAPVDVTLVDRSNHHLFQPLLYQVATGVLSPGQIAPALRALFRRQPNVHVLLADVDDVDLERRVVHGRAIERIEIPYDSLIVATGSTYSYFGHDEWSELAPGIKTLDDAVLLRNRILGAFEMADQEPERTEQSRWMTFAIVGAGPTGVELAGQIAVLAQRVLRGEYDHIDTANARVLLLDAAPNVLGGFPEKLGAEAARDLGAMGVEVRLNAPVVDIDATGVTIDAGGQRSHIAAGTVIWAAGVNASPLAARLAEGAGMAVDRAGRLHVESDLTLTGHPQVFAVGDMIAIPGVPATAQPALQEGKYVAGVIRSRLAGQAAPAPFTYRDLGMIAVIGRTKAVADLFGRVRLGGFPAFLIWGVVHLAYLVGWGNRFEAVARWMWTLLARNRRERVISTAALARQEADAESAVGHGRE